MGRLVRAVPRSGLQAGEAYDNYMERVAKLVPSEVLAAYLAIESLVTKRLTESASPAAADSTASSVGVVVSYIVSYRTLAAASFVALLVFNVFYLLRSRTVGQPFVGHIVLSCIAFIVWVYAVKGSVLYPLYDPTVAGILVILFTLGLGIFEPRIG